LQDQAGAQKRIAGGLRSLGDELHSMAEGSEQSGPATDLVRQGADRTSAAASWRDDREPGAPLEEIKGLAGQRSATLLAAGAGVLAGRLTYPAAAGPDDGISAPSGTSRTSSTGLRATSSGTAPIAGTGRPGDRPGRRAVWRPPSHCLGNETAGGETESWAVDPGRGVAEVGPIGTVSVRVDAPSSATLPAWWWWGTRG